jgi:predicted permease
VNGSKKSNMAFAKSVFVFLVLAMIISHQVEARRTILKGRRSLTRTYLRDSPIPAWAVIILVGLGEIIVGVVVFFVMKRIVIDPPIVGSYTPANTEEA